MCNICGGHSYGSYHVNMHPHLKLHEECVCMQRARSDSETSRITGKQVKRLRLPDDKNIKADLYVLEPEDLLKLLEIRLDQDPQKKKHIEEDIQALEQVVEERPSRSDFETIYFVPFGIDVKNPTATFSEKCWMLGSSNETFEHTDSLGIIVRKAESEVAVNALKPILYGSRAMKFWCNQYNVKCREVTNSDYDICVFGDNIEGLTFTPFRKRSKEMERIAIALREEPQSEKTATTARNDDTRTKKLTFT